VYPVVPPQDWFGDTMRVDEGLDDEEVLEEEAVVESVEAIEVEELRMTELEELVGTEMLLLATPPALRYQFAGGSFRHSPTVTGL
jgi:hypothetical protein